MKTFVSLPKLSNSVKEDIKNGLAYLYSVKSFSGVKFALKTSSAVFLLDKLGGVMPNSETPVKYEMEREVFLAQEDSCF